MQSFLKAFVGCCLIAGLCVITTSAASAQATISTDRWDYIPGDTVHVSGSGWYPG